MVALRPGDVEGVAGGDWHLSFCYAVEVFQRDAEERRELLTGCKVPGFGDVVYRAGSECVEASAHVFLPWVCLLLFPVLFCAGGYMFANLVASFNL